MTLETVYYITQIIAVAAVVASLIFVAFQIQQNTDQIRVQNSAHLQERWDNWWLMVGQDSELALAYGKLLKGERVDPPQAAQLRVFTAMLANVAWTSYVAWKSGTGSAKLAHESELFYCPLITTTLGYEVHKGLFSLSEPMAVEGEWFENANKDYFSQEWLDRIEKRRADILAERAKVTAEASAASEPEEEPGE